jgi:hypothetical protein
MKRSYSRPHHEIQGNRHELNQQHPDPDCPKTPSVETLKTEGRDDLDFHALAVWDIRKALEAAFMAGVELGHQTPKATEQDIAGNH